MGTLAGRPKNSLKKNEGGTFFLNHNVETKEGEQFNVETILQLSA